MWNNEPCSERGRGGKNGTPMILHQLINKGNAGRQVKRWVILCIASQAHPSREPLLFLSALLRFLFRMELWEQGRKRNRFKTSNRTDRGKREVQGGEQAILNILPTYFFSSRTKQNVPFKLGSPGKEQAAERSRGTKVGCSGASLSHFTSPS